MYVKEYFDRARILLQDTVVPFRYPNYELLAALNLALNDAFRLRYDFWRGRDSAPQYYDPDEINTPTDPSTQVDLPTGYETAVIYCMVGWIMLRDDEVNQLQTASAYMTRFHDQLLTLK